MKQSPISKLRRGFTLVELLVCIVIVVVLASLALAMTKKAMAKARLTSSIAKVRDIGVRVAAYADDHGGLLPVWKSETDNLYWWGMLVDDPKNDAQLENLYRSPGDRNFNVRRIESEIAYGWNSAVVGRTDAGDAAATGMGQKRMVNFSDPTQVLVLSDGPKSNGYGEIGPNKLPDENRFNGKAAGLLLDGSGREFTIESEFKNNSKWFMSPEEREQQGK